MIAKLQKGEAAARSPASKTSNEAAPTADHQADGPSEQRDLSGHRLRNRIILANAIAWSLIIAVILWAIERTHAGPAPPMSGAFPDHQARPHLLPIHLRSL